MVHIDGNRMEILQTERLQIIIGWIFVLLGPAVAITGGYLYTTRHFQSQFIPLMIIGTLIGLTGVLCINLRSAIRIDRALRSIEKLSGFRSMHPRETWSFDNILEVRVKEYSSRGSEGQAGGKIWFGITLELKQGQPEMLMRLNKPVPARRTAEVVARFIGKPLRNSLNHGDSVRQPEQLDWPLGRLLRESEASIPFPEKPNNSLVEAHLENRTLTLKIPAPGFFRGGILWAIILEPMIIGPLFMAAGFVGEATNPAFLTFLAAVAIIPATILALWSLYRGSEQIELTVTPEHLQLNSRTLFGSKQYDFSANQIEELTWFAWPASALGLVRTGGLSVYTDDQILSFAAWLKEADQQFIWNALRHILIKPSNSTDKETMQK